MIEGALIGLCIVIGLYALLMHIKYSSACMEVEMLRARNNALGRIIIKMEEGKKREVHRPSYSKSLGWIE